MRTRPLRRLGQAIRRTNPFSIGACAAGLLLLAGCTNGSAPKSGSPSSTVSPKGPENAAAAGVKPGPGLAELAVTPASASAALKAFRISCPSLVSRTDNSGLAQPGDWVAACAAAPGWPADRAGEFFAAHFEPVIVGDGKAFATGYYEPRIAGSRTRAPGYETPVHSLPADLVEVDLGAFSTSLAGRRVRGRVESQKLIPYHDRAAIEDGALDGRGLEIAWAADPVELFFLHIQGSGQLLLPDGKVMRIGYAGQNGRDYVAIGGLMRQRGLLTAPVTMQSITAWLRANPEEGRKVMRENRSYIFFTELTGEGPLGALGKPVTPRASVAADPKFVPLGAPVILAMDRPEAGGMWIAQDTGGAIKGANRFDTFWGAGDEAARLAGGMSARGQAWILLPKGRGKPGDAPARQ